MIAKRVRIGLPLLLAALLPLSALASGTLSIRLVRASHTVQGADPRLRDVAQALGASFAFQGYTLVAQTSMPLPAEGRQVRLGAYTVRCAGNAHALSIQVDQGRRRLLNTTAGLRGRRPLILGGFPAGAGDVFVLVFVAL